jgi:hypothetical protein
MASIMLLKFHGLLRSHKLMRCLTGKWMFLALAFSGFLGLEGASYGDVLTYDFDFPGSTTIPSVQATFQGISPGDVSLTISALNLSGDGLGSLYFNLNPALSPTSLVFNETSQVGLFPGATVQTGVSAFRVLDSGKYDIKIGFNSSPGQSFQTGDSVTFNITGIPGLDAADFNAMSTPSASRPAGNTSLSIMFTPFIDGFDPGPPQIAIVNGRIVPDGGAGALLLGIAAMAMGAARKKTWQAV